MTTSTPPPVFKLAPGIQSYAWGKKGSSSLSAQLAQTCIPDFKVDEDKTYAELWMGTHPTLPSTSPHGPLSNLISANPSLVGDKITSAFPDSRDGSLPFLFKVLSIGTALSIQAHPDKELAGRLFRERPDVYKDNNHKPEMAIALTPFLAFLNFLPLPSISAHLSAVPELAQIVDESTTSALASSVSSSSASSEEQKDLLQKVFGAFMTLPPPTVSSVIRSILERFDAGDVKETEQLDLKSNGKGGKKNGKEAFVHLFRMLNDQYPDDVGVLCVYLLNVVELEKGEAAFLGANMPHAYISGDIIECMATSDNVVRAGLTPKLRDVDTLVSMLTYEAGPGSKQLLSPVPWSRSSSSSGAAHLYDPPIAEFSVVRISLKGGESDVHEPVDGPSIVVVTEGTGTLAFDGNGKEEFKKGDVLFIGAGEEVQWEAGEGVEAYRAFVEA